MASRKFVLTPFHRPDAAASVPPNAEVLASRLALVAGTSPGAFYLVSGIIEGILAVAPPADVNERVH
jgi:hypothetical protein